jgi:acetolactate synthase-1/3 small subunit
MPLPNVLALPKGLSPGFPRELFYAGAFRAAHPVNLTGKAGGNPMPVNNGDQEKKRQIFSILVDNEPGVLARVSGLFSGRGFNIDSLCVAETTDPSISRITLTTVGDIFVLEQIKKQLNKMINVIKVVDFAGTSFVQREMALIKVRARPEHRAEILRIVDIFRSRIVDVSSDYYIVEVTGDEDKLGAFLTLLKPMGIKEIASTGVIALAREKK